ncbi:MAG TPA: MerR family transcriptional regulator, partial [Firmicutes bacterium]|nr:MerR family transcriptional regulator [Bacillota bacterium]
MELMTISEVTKAFNVTTRMLRYYDEIGLLPSARKENYSYRVYDESAVRRLQQI